MNIYILIFLVFLYFTHYSFFYFISPLIVLSSLFVRIFDHLTLPLFQSGNMLLFNGNLSLNKEYVCLCFFFCFMTIHDLSGHHFSHFPVQKKFSPFIFILCLSSAILTLKMSVMIAIHFNK